ncbi:hypothetical protein CAPTEDRAFT_74442, partial [Capitella teleta]
WVLPNWFDDLWTGYAPKVSNCTKEQMIAVLDRSLYVGQMTYNPSEEIGISGRTAKSFDETFLEYSGGVWPIGSAFRIITYDSVWHAALGLNATLSKLIDSGSNKRLENFVYSDIEMADLISESVREVSFDGISGHIQMDEYGATHPLIAVTQQLGDTRKLIAYYNIEDSVLTLVDGGPVWTDGVTPKDSSAVVLDHIRVSSALYGIMSFLALIGIVQGIGYFAVNTHYRTTRIIKMSSPNINNLVIAGCLLSFATVFVADVKMAPLSTLAICNIRMITFTLGFSLAFGALFAKTWRVHVI